MADDKTPPPQPSRSQTGLGTQPSRAGVQPSSSRAQIQQSSSRAQVQPSSSVAQVQPSSSRAQIQQSSSRAQVQPSSSVAQVQPSSSRAQIQQSSSRAQVQPSSSIAQVQPSSSRAQIQQSSSRAHVQPSSSIAQVQPSSSRAQIQQSSSKAQIQPSSSIAQVQPSSSRAQIQQSSSKAQFQPSSSKAQIQPSSSRAETESSGLGIQPSVAIQPNKSKEEIQSLGKGKVGFAHVTAPGKMAYSAETYVGNWYEQTVRNTMTREDFMKKRECEELSIQKSQIMVDFLLKPVRLTARPNGFVYFGDSIQIISPGPDCPAAIEAFPFKKYCKFGQLALSASVPPTLIDYRPFLDTESLISASPHLYPVVRNSFVIERPDCPEDCGDNILHYGDLFRLRAMPTQHFALYLHSAPATPLHTAAIHSARPQVRFSDTPNPNTLWRAVPLDPLTKMKMDFGIGVPLKTRMLIQHALSGNNLSLEPNFPVITYFGHEHEVTVHNKKDRVQRPAWTNHWAFDTERGWRKPDKQLVEQAKFNAAINSNIAAKYASEEAKYTCEEDGDPNKNQDPREQDQAECAQQAQDAAEQQQCERQQTLEQFEKNQLSRELAQLRLDTEVPGHTLAYDYRTAPQPHAHEYRLSEQQEFYPNKKYDCDGTECCNYRSQPTLADYPYVPPKSDCYEIEPRASCNK